jgi:YidC/Oxa1 family membrane protein insertase
VIPSWDEGCSQVQLVSWETTNVLLPVDQKVFENIWNYTVDVNIADKEYTVQFETKHRGTIGQLFVYLFYAPIYNLMAYILSHVWYSLGFAIIILTIIVRILLIYPQHKMMVNQKRMQNIQPKIQEIQEKNKWNQAVIGQELLALYKKEGVNPFGACGLLIIQMPILIVIYNVIQSINSQSNSFYVYDFLSYFQIDKINPFFYNINLLESGGIVGLLLALVVWVLQYFQIKLSLAKNKKLSSKWEVLEKKKNSNDLSSMMPDPEMINRFMLYGMPSMVAVFTFFFLAGLWIYWWMTTIFMIFQQIFINKILKKSS